MVNKRPGRPAGGASARSRLLDAAHRHFEAGDLARISARALADEVGVSHTLVNYHFGSRDALLAAVTTLRVAPHQVIAATAGRDGHIDIERLIRALVSEWEHPDHGAQLVEVARLASSREAGSAAMQEYLQRAVFEPLVESFGQKRARRMATAIVGVVYGRYVLELPVLARLTRHEVVEHLLSMMR
ncbi:TetR family transcriptional regulator [Paramicrobacterium chengjingii]|uniref:TetR family transcriptional regulator n=1 Tax=Paramicrobacterium chengjingii TaxID=2769067 RepID=A0ABX6YF12_9MICO|nr:TetR family transcriptional regulator [Microbacterium chengjingii]QPZ37323.1 TetR family transcriptional regulator [Microbacterium chengjingii]